VGRRFNPPPNWPPPPPGFVPPPRWQPDPSWSPPPPGWQVWVDDPPPGEQGEAPGQEESYPGGPTALDYLDGSYTPPDAPGPPSERPNGFAVAAFVLGAIGGTILSVVLAIIALRQIKNTGQRGRGLAIAGLAFSVIWGAALAAFLLLHNPGSAAQQPPAGTSRAASPSAGGAGQRGGSQQTADVFSLRAGECFQNPPASQTVLGITYVTVVPCTTPHNAQVIVEFAATGSSYPGTAALKRQADQGCHARLTGRVVKSRITSTMTLRFLYPLATSWSSGHRTISCLVVDSASGLRDSLLRSR
jgi:Domain of unknown function (DUF4190)/Septum formation